MQTALDLVLLKSRLFKNLRIGEKIHLCSRLFRLCDLWQQPVFQLHHGHAALIAVMVYIALPADLHIHVSGERVDHGGAHAVQTAARLVHGIIKLSACMKRRVDDAGCRNTLRVHPDRNAAPVVLHGAGAVCLQRHTDRIAGARQMLVHRVVHDLIDQMVQSLSGHASDVHTGSFSYGFESFQYGNTALVISCCIRHFLKPHLSAQNASFATIPYFSTTMQAVQNICFAPHRKKYAKENISCLFHALFLCTPYNSVISCIFTCSSLEIPASTSADAAISSVLAARFVMRSLTSSMTSVRWFASSVRISIA